MAISSLSAANTACEASGWKLTNLSLQKILYLSHMKFLGKNNGQPLIRESFEAWKYGPVVPSLYKTVKRFGENSISDIFLIERVLSRPEHIYIKETVAKYGHVSPGKLVELTHRPGGAWEKCYRSNIDHIVIPNHSILEEFLSKGL